MIPVLGPDALREADAWTIRNEPISSLGLMERAARACADRIMPALAQAGHPQVVVVAGMGNNGGDGLAIARMLSDAGERVHVVRILHREEPSADHLANLHRVRESGIQVSDVASLDQWPLMPDRAWMIDALVGIGLKGPLSGLAADVVRAMNRSACCMVSIDMPSGLMAEGNGDEDPVIRAVRTLTFEVPKLSFLLPENERFVGEWEIIRIGLDADYLHRLPTSHRIAEARDAGDLLVRRGRFAHKGQFGHAYLIAGQEGRMGAAVLAARACCRSGAGLITAHVPRGGLPVMQAALPEAMCTIDAASERITGIGPLEAYTAIGCGPGMGVFSATRSAVRDVLHRWKGPLVLDADALNVLAEERDLLACASAKWVLTPHPKEFDRLAARRFDNGRARLECAGALAAEWGCHIILKGAYSAICKPDASVVFNPTGGPGMARGGSGDALTGVLTSLLAQGLSPYAACLLGTYAHGLAGDIAAGTKGIDGMLTTDLVEALPEAWRSLRARSTKDA
jgi:hydroxyethylthiazole kinase-like uncharacterized protein yjeF